MKNLMPKAMLVALTGVASGPIGAHNGAADVRPYPPLASPFSRLRTEGVRAMSRGDAEKLAAAGFNLALPWERLLHGSKKTMPPDSPILVTAEDFSEQVVEELRAGALQCRENNIFRMSMIYAGAEGAVRYLAGLEPGPGGHLLDYIGYGGRDPLQPKVKKVGPAHQYRHVVDWNGQAARWAPCPLERIYWMGFIRPQLELVARVLQDTGTLGGAALELETYCFYDIYPGMASQKKTFCYCDHCFYGFVHSLGEGETPDAVLPGKRFDWLTQRGLLGRYENYLEDCLADLVGEMLHPIRKGNPNFLFGFYPYAPFWYYDALIRGGGTPELPCLVFSSSEYHGGYSASPAPTFFGDASTAAGLAHLRQRQLPAMYVGGLYDRGMRSPDAVAMAMDRMLRGPDGYWDYRELDDASFPLWEPARAINQWTTDHPGPLPSGTWSQNALAAAMEWVAQTEPEGLAVNDGRIVASFAGPPGEVRIVGGDFESDEDVARGWRGRGSLPQVDDSGERSSLRFEPSAAREGPRSPYIDQEVPGARAEQSYELSCWVKTAGASKPIRFWVGQADSSQYPAYMRYFNYVLPPHHKGMYLRTPVSYWGMPPLVLRFWCPPTDGQLWLDEVRLRPVQARVIQVPLVPPEGATGWGSIEWQLSPADARCDAQIIAAEDHHSLRQRLYSGDSLAPLEAITGLRPVTLSLTVYPSASEPVSLDKVQVRFTGPSR